MKAWLSCLPDEDALVTGLTSALAGANSKPVAIVTRSPNPHASAFPSEVVTCQLESGERLQLFCKYDNGRDHCAHGHRGGVAYEAEIYRRLLAPAGFAVPRFYGTAAGPAGEVWLFLGNLERCVRLRDSHDPADWERAAGWSGRCHAEDKASSSGATFVNTYDAHYYASWARRTAEYAGALHADFPWLADLCRRAEAALSALAEFPPTLIHGEYYPKNLLVCDGTIYPVDWESAAFAAGEIDLATLTDGCDPDLMRRCERAYVRARFPLGATPEFHRALELARLYVHLRWLGDQPGHKLRRRFWRYDEVLTLGGRLGLL
jgi:hypothetical protein